MSFFATIGRFVSEFARFILFFASIIFLLSSLLLLLASSRGRNDLNPVEINGVRTVLTITVGFSIYLILLAIAGIFASFFSSKGTIKLLAVMTALNVGIGVAVLFTASPKIDEVHEDLLEKLAQFQSQYDWDHSSSSSSSVKGATSVWDNIQADVQCCGLNAPKDWSHFRPKGHEAEKILPKSCCKRIEDTINTSGYCDANKSESWSDGCSANLGSIFAHVMDMVIFTICFNVVVGVLASIVLCCNPYSSQSYSESSRY